MAKISLVTITPDAEKIIELCGRNCYDSIDRITATSHKQFLPNVLKRGHFSLLSFAHAVFHVSEISRACSHQFVRHAHVRYLQRSQRYCQEDRLGFVIPPSLEGDAELKPYYTSSVVTSFGEYAELIHSGVKPEDARYALPNACYTELSAAANLQGWWDFLRLRLDKSAQWEIRDDTAKQIYKLLNAACPNIFNPALLTIQPKLNLEFPEA